MSQMTMVSPGNPNLIRHRILVVTGEIGKRSGVNLSIIIVNWNSKNYLRKAIASVEAETKGIEFEVIVIDGGSYDGCGEMLSRHYPHVVFIQSDKNLGFAKANNEAFKVSRGRNILFLNPDTEVEHLAIRTLYDQLEVLHDAGIVGPKILNTDRLYTGNLHSCVSDHSQPVT